MQNLRVQQQVNRLCNEWIQLVAGSSADNVPYLRIANMLIIPELVEIGFTRTDSVGYVQTWLQIQGIDAITAGQDNDLHLIGG